jgi:uncharacterized BrkB/YihY/UPF0761 family membrane protein
MLWTWLSVTVVLIGAEPDASAYEENNQIWLQETVPTE